MKAGWAVRVRPSKFHHSFESQNIKINETPSPDVHQNKVVVAGVGYPGNAVRSVKELCWRAMSQAIRLIGSAELHQINHKD